MYVQINFENPYDQELYVRIYFNSGKYKDIWFERNTQGIYNNFIINEYIKEVTGPLKKLKITNQSKQIKLIRDNVKRYENIEYTFISKNNNLVVNFFDVDDIYNYNNLSNYEFSVLNILNDSNFDYKAPKKLLQQLDNTFNFERIIFYGSGIGANRAINFREYYGHGEVLAIAPIFSIEKLYLMDINSKYKTFLFNFLNNSTNNYEKIFNSKNSNIIIPFKEDFWMSEYKDNIKYFNSNMNEIINKKEAILVQYIDKKEIRDVNNNIYKYEAIITEPYVDYGFKNKNNKPKDTYLYSYKDNKHFRTHKIYQNRDLYLFKDIYIGSGSNLKLLVFSEEKISFLLDKRMKDRHMEEKLNCKNIIKESNLYYEEIKKTLNPKKLIITLPGYAGEEFDNSFISYKLNYLNDDDYVLLAFYDSYFTGTYMSYDNQKKNIFKNLIKKINNELNKYNLTEDDLIIVGFSKGGTIALRTIPYFKKSRFIITVPQNDLNLTKNIDSYKRVRVCMSDNNKLLDEYSNVINNLKYLDEKSIIIESLNDPANHYNNYIEKNKNKGNYNHLVIDQPHGHCTRRTLPLTTLFIDNSHEVEVKIELKEYKIDIKDLLLNMEIDYLNEIKPSLFEKNICIIEFWDVNQNKMGLSTYIIQDKDEDGYITKCRVGKYPTYITDFSNILQKDKYKVKIKIYNEKDKIIYYSYVKKNEKDIILDFYNNNIYIG